MNKLIILLVAVLGSLSLQAQEINVGDVYEIGKPENASYSHINFPRPNFIIKKGGIANYKMVEGNQVVVTSVKEKKDGTMVAKIKRKDGRKFFNSHYSVTVDIDEALKSGELQSI